MKTSRFIRPHALLALLLLTASFARAGTDDVARAAAIVQRIVELNQKFSAYDVQLDAPTPAPGVTGKFLLPIDENGALTEWAQKALQAQIGNIAGEQAGAAAAKGLGSVVPGGGLASGLLKKKGKEAGAMAALGGPEFVKNSSRISFNTVQDFAVYLHAKAGKSADYSKAVQAAIALYPDLEKSYAASVAAAFDAAVKKAAAQKAAAEKAAAEAAAKQAAAEKAAASAATAANAAAAPTAAVTAPAAP